MATAKKTTAAAEKKPAASAAKKTETKTAAKKTTATSAAAKKTAASTAEKKTSASTSAAKKTASSATAKKPAASASAKPAAAEKTSSAGSSVKLTAGEKKLLEAYRAADQKARDAAMAILTPAQEEESGSPLVSLLSALAGAQNHQAQSPSAMARQHQSRVFKNCSAHHNCHFWLPVRPDMSMSWRNSSRTGPHQSLKTASTGRGIGILNGISKPG